MRLVRLPARVDDRGTLLPFDFADLPFVPRRAFVVHDVPAGAARGGHAHLRGQQLLVRLSGRIAVELRCDGDERRVELASSARGVLIAPGVWSRQTYHGPDARLLVFADEPYDPASYVSEA